MVPVITSERFIDELLLAVTFGNVNGTYTTLLNQAKQRLQAIPESGEYLTSKKDDLDRLLEYLWRQPTVTSEELKNALTLSILTYLMYNSSR